MKARGARVCKPTEPPPGFGVRWLGENGADTALASLASAVSQAKAVCALTPHPPHSKTLARAGRVAWLFGGAARGQYIGVGGVVAQIANLLYRRLAVGRLPELPSACGLDIRGPAELPAKAAGDRKERGHSCPPFGVLHHLHRRTRMSALRCVGVVGCLVAWNSALRLAATRTRGIRLLASIAVTAGLCLAAAAAELRLGQAIAPPGSAVSVPVSCAGASGAVGAQFDVSFNPSSVTLVGISGDPAQTGHLVDQQQLAPGHWRGLVYSLTNGLIAPGAVVWLNFNIASNAPDGVVPLVVSNAIVAQAAGKPVQPLAQVSGALTVWSGEWFTTAGLAGAGQLRMIVTGPPERVFTLQGTPDLFHWADLATYTNPTGTLVLTNYLQAGRSAYFYRTVFRPGVNPPAVPAPTLSDVGLLADGTIRFQLNSTAGSAWRIEGSPDLVYWGNYGMVTNASGTVVVTNTPFMRPKTYFYRAAAP